MTVPLKPLDWPDRTNEEWMRSRVDRFFLETRQPGVPAKASPKALDRNADFSGRLTFVDGVLTGVVLDPELKKQGVVFGPHADAAATVKDHLAQGHAAADTLASANHYSRVEFGAVLAVPPPGQLAG